MADWRNRMEQIVNKFKFQLNAKGIDNIQQLKEVFMVSQPVPSSLHLKCLCGRTRTLPFLCRQFNNCNLIWIPLTTLQSFDKNGNQVLEKLEFEAFLSKLGVFLTTQELRTVHNHFDHNKDGAVSMGEFMSCLKVSKPLFVP